MNRKLLHFGIGLVIFLIGGVILTFGGETSGTAVGTTMGLAGLGIMIWTWLRR